jgi:hypothetical protein
LFPSATRVRADRLMLRSVLSALYWYLSRHSSRTRAIAVVYGDIATGGDNLGITHDTLDALTKAATPPTDGKFDQVLRADTTLSLGYCKP